MSESKPPAENKTKGQPCSGEIHILADEPAQEDELGSHDALAAAIAHLVGNERGGKAIALEGAWGSGKSTVVSLLRTKLENDATGKVFVFDSWAHEGDSLRRSLVEEFRTWVNEQNLVRDKNAEEWKRLETEIDKFARRLTKSEVKSKITLSVWGRLMVFLLALVPAGAMLAPELHWWHHWAAIGLVFAPVLLLVVTVVVLAVQRLRGRSTHQSVGVATQRQQNKESDNNWNAFDAALGIFLREIEKETTTKGWSTPDPTSIEFAKTLQDLLIKALQWMPNQKLLIVLDNLDRLPGREAIRAFATLRALLDRAHDTSEGLDRLWLLVPYDPTALHGSPAPTADAIPILPTLQTSLIAPGAGISTADETEMAFRDKFFQSRFRVPQPVLIRWQDYLKNCLKQSLPGHNAPALHEDICNLFTLVRDHGQQTRVDGADAARYTFPTPREIKLFVNRLATVHLQWPCELARSETIAPPNRNHYSQSEGTGIEPVPLIIQAGFALCERRVKPKNHFLEPDLSTYVPGSTEGRFFEGPELRLLERALPPQPRKADTETEVPRPSLEWERHIAAIWYGVPQNEALHMLLRPPIRARFLYGGSPDRQILASRKIPGFWRVARAVAQEFLGRPDRRSLFSCGRTLAELANWKDQSNEWREVWRLTQDDAVRILSQPESAVDNNLSPPTGEDLAKAIQNPEAEPQFGRAALQVLTRIPPGPADGFFQTWANVAAVAMHAMSARGWEPDISSFRVPDSPIAFVALLSAAQKFPNLGKTAVEWQAPGGPEAVIHFFRAGLENRSISPEQASALAWLSELHPDWPWDALTESLLGVATEATLNPAVRSQLVRALRTQLEQPGPSLTRQAFRQQVRTRIGSSIQLIIQARQQQQMLTAPAEVIAQIYAEIEELKLIQQILSRG